MFYPCLSINCALQAFCSKMLLMDMTLYFAKPAQRNVVNKGAYHKPQQQQQ